MQHLRILCPGDASAEVVRLLRDEPGTAHVVLLRGAAVEPPGDLVEADVARESSGALLGRIEGLACGRDVAISIEDLSVTVSRYAERAEREAPGEGVDAVVWEEVEARTRDESQLSWSYLTLMVVAVLLATVGVVTDSSVLVVGAMVIGPDFGPMSGLTLATIQRRWGLARRALTCLLVGFPAGIVAAYALTLVADHTSGLPPDYLAGRIPLTSFASHPDGWALVTALLAGVAGVVSLTSAKASALVGVAVSVTTIPAAGAAGAALAAGRHHELVGALAQLGVNLLALYVAGLLTLGIRRGARHRRRAEG